MILSPKPRLKRFSLRSLEAKVGDRQLAYVPE
jgi:hypothetical protein